MFEDRKETTEEEGERSSERLEADGLGNASRIWKLSNGKHNGVRSLAEAVLVHSPRHFDSLAYVSSCRLTSDLALH